MKKLASLLFIFVLCVSLSSCQNTGNPDIDSASSTNGPEVDYGSSAKFSETEIKSAVDIVLMEAADLKGCELQKIWYDERLSDPVVSVYLSNKDGATEENVIVLFTNLYFNDSGNPGYTLEDFKWILVRDSSDGKWRTDHSITII